MIRATLGAIAASVALAVSAHAAVVTDDLVFNYDGDGQTTAAWTSSTPGSNTSREWVATGSLSLGASGSTGTNITTAYDLSGGGFTGTAFNGVGTSASFEVWFKPDSLAGGKQVIFETGGTAQGLSLTLWDGVLKFEVKQGNTFDPPPAGNIISYTLAAGDIADFTQVVVTVQSTGTVLYVNPVSAADASVAAGTGSSSAFAGGEAAGLGILGNNLGGGVSNPSANEWASANFIALDGKIGLFRVYDDVLTGSEVAANFSAVAVPEPASLALASLGGLALLRRRRRPAGSTR